MVMEGASMGPLSFLCAPALALWTWLGLGPGKMRIDHVKTLINEIMAVSTLLSGFSIGMSAKVTNETIEKYAEFLKAEFFGKQSHFCTIDLPAHLKGARPLTELPSYDLINTDKINPSNSYCNDDGCWVGHWQSNHAAKVLGLEQCTLDAETLKNTNQDYWKRIIDEKVAAVQLELGANTMSIIMTTVVVVTLGSLMRLSLVKRFDAADAWLTRFYPVLIVFVCLPLINFYHFLTLAQRVIRILWYYCDDYITSHCMVSNTYYFEQIKHTILPGIALLVWLLHISLPAATKPDPVSPEESIEKKLEKLVRMKEAGDLKPAEFELAKYGLLESWSTKNRTQHTHTQSILIT
mmetsp:Transcript_32441/g.64678  ORF Transcript_32441/g.64678 Transcript_32441/m.64678 type:complete len:350 (-) Transcript_32441:377-1426(-)